MYIRISVRDLRKTPGPNPEEEQQSWFSSRRQKRDLLKQFTSSVQRQPGEQTGIYKQATYDIYTMDRFFC
jgi:hypothetical protein